ncbi:hypothetical protein B0T16DRAFT_489168 [Cercophora newfieldiana]|uniref:Uncharacterized protein n=1 Tax=Cercophora newfieldiana TaxID=92897 RepID=A0AA40CUE1_9PEZI|nr:hypothetical protein B0T16DRAFT_489168 [Cercophora newfieldiana]
MTTTSTFQIPKALTRTRTIKESWGFRKHWRSAVYYTGDLYQDELQDCYRAEWKVEHPEPYLQFVRDISSEWPHLRGLADFMEVGTEPVRWRDFFCADGDNKYTYSNDETKRACAQKKRVEKTRVSQIVYFEDDTCEEVATYTRPGELGEGLAQLKPGAQPEKHIKLRLFVVEDLSRSVIEQLGSTFNIDPEFFRAHAFDYVWFNIRDPLWDPPSLHVDAVRRDWFQLRFCRARYFSSRQQFNQGQEAANLFNIGRKLYEDENKAFWDSDTQSKLAKVLPRSKKGGLGIDQIKGFLGGSSNGENPAKEKAPDVEIPRPAAAPAKPESKELPGKFEEKIDGKVGLMRTKATMWTKRWEEGDCDIAVLLLDPTIEEGFPLWRGYRNWGPIPSFSATTTDRTALLNASRVPSLTKRTGSPQTKHQVFQASKPSPPAAPPASFFSDFLFWTQRPSAILNPPPKHKLNDTNIIPMVALLRLVSAEWLTMSQYIKTRLSQIDWEITHPKEFLTQTQIDIILNKLHTWRRLVPQYREMITETQTRVFRVQVKVQTGRELSSLSLNTSDTDPLSPFRDEFRLVLAQMEEYERRIDRLTTVVTSAISIVDSRRVERLTLLAMLFVPLSLVGTLFSMSDDISEIRDTFGWWAVASASCVVLLFSWTAWSRKQSLKAK